jgi:protein-tyrosine phosphatase
MSTRAIQRASPASPRPSFPLSPRGQAAFYDRVWKNPISTAGALTALTFTVMIIVLPTKGFGGLLALALLAKLYFSQSHSIKNRIYCESMLLLLEGASRLPKRISFKWHTEITKNITLGGNILLTDDKHPLFNQNFQAVLSFLTDEEMQAHLIGYTATKDHWQSLGADFLNLQTPDFAPMSLDLVDEGVAFMWKHHQAENKLLVHCNAGIERSASIYICFCIKHLNMTHAQAVDSLWEKRATKMTVRTQIVLDYIKRHNLNA